ENSTGGGVLNVNCAPTFTYTIISKNIAASYGAGIMDKGGTSEITNCLLKDNISTTGGGAGLCIVKGAPKINGSVFVNNNSNDTTDADGGGAILIRGAKLEIVNSIFTFNAAGSKGGAIYNSESRLTIINCTFSENRATLSARGIWNDNNSSTVIKNTIFWNDVRKSELGGSGFEVSYSCLTNTNFMGNGNINEEPKFVNSSQPAGMDGIFGTLDDGLRLLNGSPCIGTGAVTGAPETDILGIEYYDAIEMGAYKHLVVNNRDCQFGRLNKDGVFYERAPAIVYGLRFPSDIRILAGSNSATVIKVFVEKDKSLRNKNTLSVDIRGLDQDGNRIPGAVDIPVTLYKVGEERNKYVFQSKTAAQGKYIIFTASTHCQTAANPYAYVICTRSFNFDAFVK
ncbi:MAG: hypothetical protein LBI42_15830, partial [Chitinispirillales bacterium]|nr:hypothetical protein [Chitinispirillales bacterium]